MSKLVQLYEAGTTWCTPASQNPPFDKRFFNTGWLTQQGYIDGAPSGGRGNTFFLNIDGNKLVLREYRRGGLVRHLSKRHYVWTGLHNTRAYKEMQILDRCAYKQLPAPKPYACRITRHGLFYTASLITYKLDGATFAHLLSQRRVGSAIWSSVGQVIADMHNADIWHADLNAHNILVDDAHAVSVIDFDRAHERVLSGTLARGNIQRLHRSLQKESEKLRYAFNDAGWGSLLSAYQARRVAT